MIKKIIITGLTIAALYCGIMSYNSYNTYKEAKKENIELRDSINTNTRVIDSLNIEISKKDKYIKEYSLSRINIKTAKSYLGTRYVYGGNTKKGIDCSGLVCNCANGKKLPRTAGSMYKSLTKIKDRVKGALVFFKFSNRVDHVGIVLDSKRFIHASYSRGVVIDDLSMYSNIVGYRKV